MLPAFFQSNARRKSILSAVNPGYIRAAPTKQVEVTRPAPILEISRPESTERAKKEDDGPKNDGRVSPPTQTGRLSPETQRRKSSFSAVKKDEEMEANNHTVFIIALFSTLAYIAFGVAVFKLWHEWTFIDSLYFVIVTLTTVGYGDHETWKSDGSVLFASLYALCGIMLMGTALGIIAAEVIAAQDEAVKEVQLIAKRAGSTTMHDLNSLAPQANLNFIPPGVRAILSKVASVLFVLGIGMVLIYFDDTDRSIIMCFYYAIATGTSIG
jgi:hypothetical protein